MTISSSKSKPWEVMMWNLCQHPFRTYFMEGAQFMTDRSLNHQQNHDNLWQEFCDNICDNSAQAKLKYNMISWQHCINDVTGQVSLLVTENSNQQTIIICLLKETDL